MFAATAIFAASLCSCALLFSCRGVGSGEKSDDVLRPVVESDTVHVYEIGAIHSLCAMRMNVEVNIGPSDGKLRISGSAELLNATEVRLDGGELDMKEDKSFKVGNAMVKATLTVPTLKEINAVAGALIEVNGLLEASEIELNAAANSSLRIASLAANSCEINSAAQCRIAIGGIVVGKLEANAVAGSQISFERGRVRDGELSAVAGAKIDCGSVEFEAKELQGVAGGKIGNGKQSKREKNATDSLNCN